MMLGLRMMSTMLLRRPTTRPSTAPVVVNRFQKMESTITGRFADAATAKASPTRKATFTVLQLDGEDDGHGAHDKGGDARDTHFLSGGLLFAVMDDVRVEVMREGGAGADRQSGDDGEDGGEGHRADEGKEQVAAQRLGEQRRGHVVLEARMLCGLRIVAAPKPRKVVRM